MRSTTSARSLSLLIAGLTFLVQSASAKKKGGGGGGGGGSGGGSGTKLDLSMNDMIIFSITVAFAVFTFFQCISCASFLSKRICPQEDFPWRKRFGVLILLAAISRTAGYALFARGWANDHRQSTKEALALSVYAAADFLPRLTDILIYLGVFALLHQRRSVFLADLATVADPSAYDMHLKSSKSPVYPIVPIILFGVMIITAFVRFGLAFTEFGTLNKAYYDTVKAYEAVEHVYMAFYILLTAMLSIMAVVLWSKVHRMQFEARVCYDEFVLAKIVQRLIPAFVIRALFGLSLHIIYYLPRAITFPTVNFFALYVTRGVVIGILYIWIFYVALDLGVLPKLYRNRQLAQEKAGA